MPGHKFRRFLLGRLDHEDLDTIQEALVLAGYEVVRTKHILTSPQLDMDVTLVGARHYITTGRGTRLNHVIDQAFQVLVERKEQLMARCSDCYTHFVPKTNWLEIPADSQSCLTSQAKHPVSIYRGEPLEDPLFV